MSKFPPLLLLLTLAAVAQADSFLSGFNLAAVSRSDATALVTMASGVAVPDFFSFAAPEPGVMLALISGAAILLARRRRS